MKHPLALVLAGALALAGCLAEEPVESAATDCSGSASARANGASASADCDGASASADGASASAGGQSARPEASAEGAAPTRAVVPFAEEGSTFHGGAVCAPPTGCVGSGLPAPGESWFEPSLSGMLDEAELTLTWSAATPLTEELILGIAYETEDGATDFVTVQGASPLTLAEKDLGIPAGNIQGIYVNAFQCNGALVVWGCASSEQPFTLEGNLVTTSA